MAEVPDQGGLNSTDNSLLRKITTNTFLILITGGSLLKVAIFTLVAYYKGMVYFLSVRVISSASEIILRIIRMLDLTATFIFAPGTSWPPGCT